MGLKKDFSEFLRTKHIVTHFKKFHFNFGLKMKDLEGGLGAEKKCVIGIFCGVSDFLGEKTGRINELIVFFPAPPRRMKEKNTADKVVLIAPIGALQL